MPYTRTAAVIALALIAAMPMLAGPLNPPAGPIISTSKPLAEVEPRIPVSLANTPGDADSLFRIAQPGSYYLTGNITGVSGKRGIEIGADNVTLDLAGFALVGVPGSLAGIAAEGPADSIELHGGLVRAWGGDGIHLTSAGGRASIIRQMRSTENVGSGIDAPPHSIVVDCTVTGNGANGIAIDLGSCVTGCAVGTSGLSGITTGSGCRVCDCTTYNNVGVGIEAGSGSTVSGCTAYSNRSSGIASFTGCTISNNTCRSNDDDGIVASSSLILDNTCTSNGQDSASGAGIHANGGDSRIEGNLCNNQDKGVYVVGSGNVIVRNTCSGNTINWDIAANNTYGPIINRVGVASAAVAGDAAGEAIGSTHPNANFTY